MVHLINEMAYVGRTPWHGLGNQLTTHQPLEVWAKQAGMNWDIKEAPTLYMAGKSKHLGEILTYPSSKILYRSDNKAPLAVVSQRYKVVQPREILEFYRDLTDVSGFELETAGVLKDGKKCWALARTGQSSTLKGNDVTNGYLLLATACDGSMATTAQFTSIRVVCNNTLAVAMRNSAGAVKVPHSTHFDAQAVKQKLGISITAWDEFMYDLKQLSERKVNTRGARSYFERVFTTENASGLAQANPKTMSKVLSLFNGQGRGAELASSKNTAFGLLNAVTEFVDHESRAKNTDYRLDSAWFGLGASIKKKALNESLLLVA